MKNLANSPRHPYAQHIKYVSQIAMKIGLIVSLGLCILAFNWTTYDINEMPPIKTYPVEKVVHVERTTHQKRTPPPPVVEPSTEIIPEKEDVEYDPEPEPELVDDKIIVEPKAEPTELPPAPIVEHKKVVPPAPPEPELPVVEVKEWDMVEEMPRFAGCEDITNDKEGRRRCAEKKLMTYIYSKIKYPAIARQNDVEGLVVIQFVVAKDGRIRKVKIAKDIGAGCGKEAARVLKNMPNWIPGKQRGRNVNVRYNIPVKFKLQ